MGPYETHARIAPGVSSAPQRILIEASGSLTIASLRDRIAVWLGPTNG
jgi:hypothetical protein